MSNTFEFDNHYIVSPNGEEITGLTEMNGKLYVFTRSQTFIVRPKKIRWWQRLWWKLLRRSR